MEGQFIFTISFIKEMSSHKKHNWMMFYASSNYLYIGLNNEIY